MTFYHYIEVTVLLTHGLSQFRGRCYIRRRRRLLAHTDPASLSYSEMYSIKQPSVSKRLHF
jgi:hypothetical protein